MLNISKFSFLIFCLFLASCSNSASLSIPNISVSDDKPKNSNVSAAANDEAPVTAVVDGVIVRAALSGPESTPTPTPVEYTGG